MGAWLRGPCRFGHIRCERWVWRQKYDDPRRDRRDSFFSQLGRDLLSTGRSLQRPNSCMEHGAASAKCKSPSRVWPALFASMLYIESGKLWGNQWHMDWPCFLAATHRRAAEYEWLRWIQLCVGRPALLVFYVSLRGYLVAISSKRYVTRESVVSTVLTS